MRKKQHPRSATARQTRGVTLDHAAPVYDLLAPLMTLGLENRLNREVIALLRLQGGEQVLDIGCGTGTLTRHIAAPTGTRQPVQCTGLDAAERMIEQARRKAAFLSHIRFDAAIAERMPYPHESFDAAVSAFFFHHVGFDLKKRVLEETARVLKPGGRFIIADVDTPTTWFGQLCARSGHLLFQQEEIAENICGKLRRAFDESPFTWQAVSHHSGFITIFVLTKKETP